MNLLPTDRRVIPGLLVVAGTVLAIGALVVGDLSLAAWLEQTLFVLVRLLPTVGLLLAIFILWVWGTGERSRELPSFATDINQDVESRSHREIAENVSERIESAARGQFDTRIAHAESEIHDTLYESGLRAIQTTVGLSETQARDALREGEWTDDPVAAAMLSTDIEQPLGERLRTLVAPGRAYRRRVERTVAAIERLESNRKRGAAAMTDREVPA